MDRLTNFGLLIFRVSVGALMLFGHGLNKFMRLLSGEEIRFPDPLGLGITISFTWTALAEFIGSIIIILGIFTRLGSLSLLVTMFVAAVIFHASDPFGDKELAFLYLVSYMLLFLTGPGKYSLQRLVENKIGGGKGLWKFLLS